MSRTFKDKPWKYHDAKKESDDSTAIFGHSAQRFWSQELPGVKTKKKRSYKDWWTNYYSGTPSWWTREFMTVPKRAACRNWEKTRTQDNLDEVCPDFGNRPHIYYH